MMVVVADMVVTAAGDDVMAKEVEVVVVVCDGVMVSWW